MLQVKTAAPGGAGGGVGGDGAGVVAGAPQWATLVWCRRRPSRSAWGRARSRWCWCTSRRRRGASGRRNGSRTTPRSAQGGEVGLAAVGGVAVTSRRSRRRKPDTQAPAVQRTRDGSTPAEERCSRGRMIRMGGGLEVEAAGAHRERRSQGARWRRQPRLSRSARQEPRPSRRGPRRHASLAHRGITHYASGASLTSIRDVRLAASGGAASGASASMAASAMSSTGSASGGRRRRGGRCSDEHAASASAAKRSAIRPSMGCRDDTAATPRRHPPPPRSVCMPPARGGGNPPEDGDRRATSTPPFPALALRAGVGEGALAHLTVDEAALEGRDAVDERVPSRWSYSCWMAMARGPRRSPRRASRRGRWRTVTFAARCTSSWMPGTTGTLLHRLPVALDELRVDEHPQVALLIRRGDVDHEDALRHADLRRREADAGRRVTSSRPCRRRACGCRRRRRPRERTCRGRLDRGSGGSSGSAMIVADFCNTGGAGQGHGATGVHRPRGEGLVEGASRSSRSGRAVGGGSGGATPAVLLVVERPLRVAREQGPGERQREEPPRGRLHPARGRVGRPCRPGPRARRARAGVLGGVGDRGPAAAPDVRRGAGRRGAPGGSPTSSARQPGARRPSHRAQRRRAARTLVVPSQIESTCPSRRASGARWSRRSPRRRRPSSVSLSTWTAWRAVVSLASGVTTQELGVGGPELAGLVAPRGVPPRGGRVEAASYSAWSPGERVGVEGLLREVRRRPRAGGRSRARGRAAAHAGGGAEGVPGAGDVEHRDGDVADAVGEAGDGLAGTPSRVSSRGGTLRVPSLSPSRLTARWFIVPSGRRVST